MLGVLYFFSCWAHEEVSSRSVVVLSMYGELSPYCFLLEYNYDYSMKLQIFYHKVSGGHTSCQGLALSLIIPSLNENMQMCKTSEILGL